MERLLVAWLTQSLFTSQICHIIVLKITFETKWVVIMVKTYINKFMTPKVLVGEISWISLTVPHVDGDILWISDSHADSNFPDVDDDIS